MCPNNKLPNSTEASLRWETDGVKTVQENPPHLIENFHYRLQYVLAL